LPLNLDSIIPIPAAISFSSPYPGLIPPTFTLFELQKTVEALSGNLLHKQNFRRLVEKSGLVEGTGKYESRTGGRPAETYRYVRDILSERLTVGPRLPVGKK
jgi:hypothetical protein